MEASSADNMHTELSADDAVSQPPYRGRAKASANAHAAETTELEERKRQAPHHPTAQRVRTVRLTTQVHPDMLIPYLYGERGGRSINAIVNATGCTIDYCALSPDEPERSPQSHGYVMNFLVSAGSNDTLEDATRQLRTLVDNVQTHLQTKARSRPRAREEMEYYEEEDTSRGRRGRMSPRISGANVSEAAMASKRDAIPDERWANGSAGMEPESGWDMAPMQRVYYAPRARRERPRYIEVTDMEADEKSEFVLPGRRPAADSVVPEASYGQRGQSPSHFVRRRVRRYPDQSRWMPRSYPAQMRDAGYAMYAAASPQGGNEQTQRIPRNRQPRHIYQGAPNNFAQSEYNLYEYDDQRVGHEVEYPDEAVDLTSENAGAHGSLEFVDVPDRHQQVHRTHPRRSLKRPLSKLRNDGPPPPPIYRQRMPYIYDCTYDDEEDEWMTEDEEMAVAYGYPPQFRPMEIPVVRRRRRFDSVSSQQWSPAARGHPQIYKRRRIPQNDASLENGMNNEAGFEASGRERVVLPISRSRTSLMGQLDEAAENTRAEAYRGEANRVEIPTEDGSTASNASDTSAGNAVVDGEKHETPADENVATENAGDVLILSTSQKPGSLVQDPTLDQRITHCSDDVDQSANEKTSEDEQLIPAAPSTPSEVMPLSPAVERTAVASPQSSVAASSSMTRKAPGSRVAIPPSTATTNVSNSVPCESEESAIDIAAERRECAHVEADQERDQEHLLPAQASIALIAGAQQSLYESQDTQPTAGVASPVELVVSDAIQINKQVIASLERVNKVEVHFAEAKASMSVQKDKFRQLESSSSSHHRLEVLCGVVYDLQCQLSSHSCGMSDTRKQELLGKLDSYVESLISEGEQTLEERVVALQTGLEKILTTHGLAPPRRAVKSKPVAFRLENTPTSKPVDPNHDENNDTVGMDWEDDGWFEESAAIDMVSDEDHVDDVSLTKSSLEFDGEYLAVKLEEDASLRWPRELPPFVLSLLARVISSDPQSYVMRATHKRLMDEIAKGDPYYYLHPTITAKETETSSPLPSSPSPPCEFGCRGASALKWERKLVSQISSRMKSFDNVAYSLARSSGGKEVLNRKKMNSIIRKLHLVAMQLHSLVSHLYCVKGQATCKEVDSLPVALNNSHFERKMGVYKSRLKLVVPHKYQQQTQQQQSSVSEPAEELLGDTYEFFPELLLCVDIWGYNYRESQAKRHNSKSLLGDELAGSGALFPLGFFRRVESLAFDFEHDSNGLLRCICDELLNIVCRWNDFKWTDNLETVALDRVISFETDVTASIVKILELYAHHLQALWAVRLLDEPEQLQSVHLTQLNAYYSDGSQGSLNTSAASRSQAPKAQAMVIMTRALLIGWWQTS
ncbi:hypothetical protein GN244_ATG01396 [Phytophthora infestans]|uniref:Uncharacterized protein n=1 Tax=Phytophthora infestans TaxID=4787 RepID=A0A833TG54_PHYIN|nr:hypothetical protein GN244_ATG01396 [Phytophthora infestans]